ncbi:MAG: alpha/beta fold hydrolase [Verrucomicrobiota bacterium]
MSLFSLHGALGHPGDWSLLAESLPLRPVALMTHRPVSFRSWAKEFANDPEVRADPCPTLLGYSMGARLALHTLLEKSNPWKAAVLLAPHPGLETEKERRERRLRDSVWAEKLKNQPAAEFSRAWNAQAVFRNSTAQDQDRPPHPNHRRCFAEWSLGSQENLVPQLERITIPILWLTGSADPIFTRIAQASINSLPNGQHRILQGCGHRIPFEKPDLVAEEITTFLNNAVGPSWSS